jgi:hypothetical protein
MPGMGRWWGPHQGDGTVVRRRSGPVRQRAPVAGGGLEVLLQHEGGTESEEGQRWRTMMVEGGSSP